MVVEELRRAVERAERQPADIQHRLAELLRDALDEEAEEEIAVSPDLRDDLAAAQCEVDAGEYVTLDELDRLYAEHARRPKRA